MGFKDLILVGCDYLSSPVKPGHFYEYGNWRDIHVEKIHKEKLLLSAKKEADIKILTVNNKYSGDIFPCISYQELTNEQPQYKENIQLVLVDDLMQLNNTDMLYKIFEEC